MPDQSSAEVVLPHGHTGSSLFHALLSEAVAQYPGELTRARLPTSVAAFKPHYGQALARFEAARINSPRRVEIARFMLQRAQAALCFGSADDLVPLPDFMQERVATPKLEQVQLSTGSGLVLEVPMDGRMYRGHALHELIEHLHSVHQLSTSARTALRWIVDHVALRGGTLSLHGERFVVLGAGAELASTELLLRAGADVLWVDLADPARALHGVPGLSGRITRAPNASNLLSQPREIAAAIRAFADHGPVHVGMFAYAPGASREWRLSAAMHAVVSSLDAGLVSSISMLISPTTPSAISRASQRSIETRHVEAPFWHKGLQRLGLIDHPGVLCDRDARVSQSTVSLQGLSYQAAQYVCKLAAAETYAVHGVDPAAQNSHPVTVSANVAGITRTRSMSHPLFRAAFEGAPSFGVRIFDPATTRALNGALMLHDLLNPDAPGASTRQHVDARDKASGVLSQQIHGGIYTLPYVLEPVIRVAAVMGLMRRPSLLRAQRAPVEPTADTDTGYATLVNDPTT